VVFGMPSLVSLGGGRAMPVGDLDMCSLAKDSFIVGKALTSIQLSASLARPAMTPSELSLASVRQGLPA
jgi:hypothetical protein